MELLKKEMNIAKFPYGISFFTKLLILRFIFSVFYPTWL